jgi:hypothetical protein
MRFNVFLTYGIIQSFPSLFYPYSMKEPYASEQEKGVNAIQLWSA